MVRRFGRYVLNSDTAYCFGGDGVNNLHRTQRSKQYFLYNSTEKTIEPIKEETAKKFACDNGFSLIRKRDIPIQASIPYDSFQDLSTLCDNSKDKMEGFVKDSVLNEINKRLP